MRPFVHELGHDVAQLLALPLTNAPAAAPADRCTKKPVSINLLDGTDAPGLDALQHIINISAVVAIAFCALGAIAGLAWIPLGRVIGVHHSGQQGRVMVVGAVGVAFTVGLIAVLINLAYSWGSGASC